MATTLPHFLSLITSILSLSSLFIPSLSSTNSFIYGGCSQLKYTANSPYESNLNSLLTSLVNSATYSSYNNFTITGWTPHDSVYGLYQCRADLAMPDCAACVAHSMSQLGALCAESCGGAIQLQGCFVKYDNTTFVGVEDKSVVLKKCGQLDDRDFGGINGRDVMLEELGGAGSGAYRVGGTGEVSGVAQCVGDLSVSECDECVKEAIGRLRSECGDAVYGDVFLGKCYARYSTSGAHLYYESHKDFSHNDSEKTFTVIIGLLAGIALLLIFLIFIRKVFGPNGK